MVTHQPITFDCRDWKAEDRLPVAGTEHKIITGVNCFINLGVCYRSPTASSEDVENMFLSTKKASEQQTLIVGDFNFCVINCNSFQGKNLYEELFINLTHDCFLTQHVTEPTRLDTGNLLDLVMTTEPNMVEN